MTDIIIIGGGPAGLTAAIYAARAGKRVCVVEKESLGGQIIYSPMVENYPAYRQISGMEFAEKLSEQVENLGIEIEYAQCLGAQRQGDCFVVRTDMGELHAAALILATGAAHKALGVSGEEALIGMGVSYCAVCDGAFFAGKHAAVVGGGNTALQEALFLANRCAKVTLIHRRNAFRGDRRLVDRLRAKENVEFLLNYTIAELCETDGELTALRLKSVEDGAELRLNVDGLFVAVGQQPRSEGFSALADVNPQGYFIAGEDALTRTEGLFVAGDVREKALRQLTTAVSDGANAALAACNYLDAR